MIAGDGRINSLLTDRRPGPLAPCSGARMSGCGVERGAGASATAWRRLAMVAGCATARPYVDLEVVWRGEVPRDSGQPRRAVSWSLTEVLDVED